MPPEGLMPPEDDAGLGSLADAALDPLFWPAERVGATSAWWRHVPFAHWIVRATCPQVLVELGTHAGVSYSAFCGAVQRAGLPTRCHEVDTWKGDDHAGRYGDAVFDEFRTYHDRRFSQFSTLIRSTFDDALPQIEDGSVDLLHIDGLHTYDAVRRDYENWLPKLSDAAVVLFHDVNERSGDFGVWRLWAELCRHHPSFTFLHSHGLGVLAVGANVPAPVRALCRIADLRRLAAVRTRFAVLGERWLAETNERMLAADLGAKLHDAAAGLHGANAELADNRIRLADARVKLADAGVKLGDAGAELAANRAELVGVRAELAGAGIELASASDHARGNQADIMRLTRELQQATIRATRAESTAAAIGGAHDAVLSSTAWGATWPLRRLGAHMPQPVRRTLRAGARLAWWTVTLRPVARRAAGRQAAPPPAGPTAEDSLQSPRIRPPALSAPDAAAPAGGRSCRVIFLSGESHTPGHSYRVERPAAALAALGAAVTWMTVDDARSRLAEIQDASLLVIWRATWSDTIAGAIAAARAGGATVAFDIDDLMIDPDLARLSVIDGIRTLDLTEEMVRDHFTGVRRTLDASDLCLTTTDELAAHARRAGHPTVVLPNGFDAEIFARSRLAVRRHRQLPSDGLIGIGYAAGSRTHQRDFALCADAVAAVMRQRPAVWLVGFQPGDGSPPILDVAEFPSLRDLAHRIELRRFVPLERLPDEVARFDINLAPLEIGNPFCEAKSELKFFEAALVSVPTIASATGPFRRAIRDGETGFLAASPAEWQEALLALVDDAARRRDMADKALLSVLWRFGPEQRREQLAGLLDVLRGGRRGAHGFALDVCQKRAAGGALPHVPAHEVVYQADRLGMAEATVLVPVYNYAAFVREALDSVLAQSLAALDLVIVDDCSTDDSLAVATAWAQANAGRFNRVLVLHNARNAGLAFSRNLGFAAAETPYVLPLDADNRLRPECAEACLATIHASGAAFAYPRIQEFGQRGGIIGARGYNPLRLQNGNYIDAMALISRAAWAAAGGYDHIRHGWEDFDFWCRLAELGLFGAQVAGAPLAEYRAHGTSMLGTTMAAEASIQHMVDALHARHPWLTIATPVAIPSPGP